MLKKLFLLTAMFFICSCKGTTIPPDFTYSGDFETQKADDVATYFSNLGKSEGFHVYEISRSVSKRLTNNQDAFTTFFYTSQKSKTPFYSSQKRRTPFLFVSNIVATYGDKLTLNLTLVDDEKFSNDYLITLVNQIVEDLDAKFDVKLEKQEI